MNKTLENVSILAFAFGLISLTEWGPAGLKGWLMLFGLIVIPVYVLARLLRWIWPIKARG